jgi:hypothetical protein
LPSGNLIARIHSEYIFHTGQPLTANVNMEKVLFFDAETEHVIRWVLDSTHLQQIPGLCSAAAVFPGLKTARSTIQVQNLERTGPTRLDWPMDFREGIVG